MEVLLIIMVRLLNVMEGGLIIIEIIDRGLIIVEIFLGLMLLFIIIDFIEMLRLMIEMLRLMIEILRLMIEILRLINLFLDYISMDDLLFLFYFNKMIKDLI